MGNCTRARARPFPSCAFSHACGHFTASYPDVSLLMKMCAQRKAGRRQRARRRFACRLYPSHGPLRFITSHSFCARLCHAKNEAPEEEAAILLFNIKAKILPVPFLCYKAVCDLIFSINNNTAPIKGTVSRQCACVSCDSSWLSLNQSEASKMHARKFHHFSRTPSIHTCATRSSAYQHFSVKNSRLIAGCF